jgi:hypothetical protein
MSKNSKNHRKIVLARSVSAQRKKGNKGGGMTKKATTKKMTWYALKDGKLGAAALAAANARAAKREAAQEAAAE